MCMNHVHLMADYCIPGVLKLRGSLRNTRKINALEMEVPYRLGMGIPARNFEGNGQMSDDMLGGLKVTCQKIERYRQ